MSLRFFEGAAGSGKTTRLMEEVAVVLQGRPLESGQKVLALTKIHGSRRRLHLRLMSIHELNHRFDCLTADSYARRLIGRWCSLSRMQFGNLPGIDDHDEFCKRAGNLITDDIVSQWVVNTYPIVVVDEMQDSNGGQLEMIQELARSAICIAAADDFQDLGTDGKNEAVEWASENGEVISLQQIHRTDVQGLLDASGAIREGRKVNDGEGFKIVCVPKSALGAWFVSKHISKWKRVGNIAIITPTGPHRSSFVKDLIARVESGPIGKQWRYGPHSVPWEFTHQSSYAEFVERVGLPEDLDEQISIDQLNIEPTYGQSIALAQWFERKRKVSARTKFSVEEIRVQMRAIQQRTRAFGQSWDRHVSAMTVHQAKNREFDSVIVIWPFEIQGSEERHRRLLYNAVTRAKKQAIVIIHDPKNDRKKSPPFAAVP